MEYPRNVCHPMAINPSKYAKPLIWISIGLTAGLTDFLMDSHAIKGSLAEHGILVRATR